MIYIWIKAFHVIVVLIWTGGLLAQSLALSSLARAPCDRSTPLAVKLQRWDRRITSPALLLVWGFGITIAILGQNFGDPWLMTKLVLAAFLSGLHGVQAGLIRKAVVADATPPSWTRWSPVISCAVIGGIALLAVVKPF